MPAFGRLAALTAAAAVSSSVIVFAGSTAATAASVATWDKVAQCESSGNWAINTGNGYYGGLQFSLSTWRAYGGTQYASYPHQATKKAQILTAEKVLAGQGPGAWPSCGRSSGLGSDHANPYPDAPKPETPAASWKSQVVVESGGGLFHSTRFDNGTWTRFGDVFGETGVPGGVGGVSESGIDGATHVLAVSNDGKLFHSLRSADRTWTGFGDVHAAAGALTNVTQVSSASIGADLHVAVVADGSVYHTIRYANGTWAPFGKVAQPAGGPVTKVAIASSGANLQMVALSGGVLQHTIRASDGTWGAWGNASVESGAAAAGITSVDDVALATTGAGDLQLVVTANGGTKQFHGARYGNGTWIGFNDLKSVVSGVTVTDVAAAQVDGEMQAAFVTTDGRVLHTIRHVDGNWTTPGSVDLAGVTGDHTGIAITATYN
ncbi:transglycosylase family protein [Streptomyces goshikiensis]|uniref:transglycosylase family protein n=1 Tax=Streptomyces goshikiensis TaxID=1942 RepID=UPI003693C8D7